MLGLYSHGFMIFQYPPCPNSYISLNKSIKKHFKYMYKTITLYSHIIKEHVEIVLKNLSILFRCSWRTKRWNSMFPFSILLNDGLTSGTTCRTGYNLLSCCTAVAVMVAAGLWCFNRSKIKSLSWALTTGRKCYLYLYLCIYLSFYGNYLNNLLCLKWVNKINNLAVSFTLIQWFLN